MRKLELSAETFDFLQGAADVRKKLPEGVAAKLLADATLRIEKALRP